MKSTYPEQLGEKRVNYLVHLGWAHLLSTGKYSCVFAFVCLVGISFESSRSKKKT